MRNKKGFLSMQQLIVIVLVTVSFLLTWQLISHAMTKVEERSAEEICRGSIAAIEKIKIEIGPFEKKVTPLLCKTQDKEIPYVKTATPDEVKKNIADLMARCWYMFGEGMSEDVLEGTIGGNTCFICYTIKTKETKEFKETIPANDLLDYMMDTPYKVRRDDDNCKDLGGKCVSNKNECALEEGWKYNADNNICLSKYSEKKDCCYSRFECLNKGGECFSEEAERDGWRRYTKWGCPPDRKFCYIKDENFYSYVDYIQAWGGQGVTVMTTDIEPGATYTIAYGEENTECGVLCSIGGGTGAVLTVGGAILLTSTGPIGWMVAGVAGGIAGYVATQTTVDIIKVFTERDLNTIYLTKLDDIRDHCTIEYGIGGD